MIRKIVFAILAIAVLAAGYIGFEKLNYWQRSARVFSYDPDQVVNGRFARGGERPPGQFENRERGERNFNPERTIPDSLRRDDSFRRPQRGEGFVPANFERRDPGRTEGRRDFGRGAPQKKVNLRNVWWFLSVFSGFTVIAIYSDKLVKLTVKGKRCDTK